jgi:2-hydroxy-3-keto-5-methylthiopentenyl-1-phosphate phosphatase
LRLRYISPRGIELNDGFKLSYASELRQLGDALVWVGDGPSDLAPSALSDAVFARDSLLAELAGARDRVFAFEDFGDVVAVLEREGQRWLEFSSSTTAAEA